jgi:hypothetical protein
MARLLVYALVGFLAAGWFLSRAFSFWLFMFVGMLFAVLRMSGERNLLPPKKSIGYLLKWSVCIAVGALAFDLLVRVGRR